MEVVACPGIASEFAAMQSEFGEGVSMRQTNTSVSALCRSIALAGSVPATEPQWFDLHFRRNGTADTPTETEAYQVGKCASAASKMQRRNMGE
jgi:hypothetical protein